MRPLNSIADEEVSWRLDADCLIHQPMKSHYLRSGASLGKISVGRSDGPGLSR
jgi:hypothetical protein